MKSQISRDSHRPRKHYSGIYLQQGRMILDADWNELTDIQKAALSAALRDAVAGGAPRTGGLALVDAGADDAADLRIAPGTLYIDGVRAQLDADAPLPLGAQPDYPTDADVPGSAAHLYADVWERNVTALLDANLMDAALHGADTATRSQTLLQVKWCADTVDPLDAQANPALGDARLTLKLNLISSAGDPCDPCASQISVDERIGNYLFRVEVHDWEPDTRWLTLKWSRDNGAEACAVADMPRGFAQGDWLWEYFDADTERLLGNHFASRPSKLRGLIKDRCNTPEGSDEPKDFVRQWDGAIRIQLDTGALAATDDFPSQDRGTPLRRDAAAQAHGRVTLADGTLRINLELIELSLALADDTRFVPGDHWLAPVREASMASGDTLLDAAPPQGVPHHYLPLGRLDASGKLVAADDAARRRMSFPPLSDIRASDVGFADNCPKLYDGAENLQDALDALCTIDAADIAYPLPECSGNTVRERLRAGLDADGDEPTSVRTTLDALLCQLDAGHLPLDGSDQDLCPELKQAQTVQEALDLLCRRPSAGGCAITVSDSKQLSDWLQRFATDKNLTTLSLCLKAGDYKLGDLPKIASKHSLRLAGEASATTRLAFGGDRLALGAEQVILENLSIRFEAHGALFITARDSRTSGCQFGRSATAQGKEAMVTVAPQDDAGCTLAWHDNLLRAQISSTDATDTRRLLDPEAVGSENLSKTLIALADPGLQSDRRAFDAALAQAAEQLIRLPKTQRAQWRTTLAELDDKRPGPILRRTRPALVEILAADTLSVAAAQRGIRDLVVDWAVTHSPDWALRLDNARVGGTLRGCRIDGGLLLGNGTPGHHPNAGIYSGPPAGTPAVDPSGFALHLAHNQLVALHTNIAPEAMDAKGTALNKPAAGHDRLFVTNNSFAKGDNTFVATSFVGQGNTWFLDSPDFSPGRVDLPGSVIAERASFNGNVLEGYADNVQLVGTVRKDRLASQGNVLIDIRPAAT